MKGDRERERKADRVLTDKQEKEKRTWKGKKVGFAQTDKEVHFTSETDKGKETMRGA